MILLFKCPKCRFSHDEKLNPNEPITIECPQCNKLYQLNLNLYELKERGNYYESDKKILDNSVN